MKYSLYIVDSDEISLNLLRRHFQRSDAFELLGSSTDGLDALRGIHRNAPDIILSDTILRSIDINGFLRSLHGIDPRPMVILYSEFISSLSIEIARRNGADHFVFKPTDLDTLETTLLQYAQIRSEYCRYEALREDASEESTLNKIFGIMNSLGFSSRYSGSAYLAEAVLLVHESEILLRNLSNQLYPRVAERMHSTPAQIERSIRTSVSAANAGGRLTRVLGCAPTNKACVRYILHRLNSKIAF